MFLTDISIKRPVFATVMSIVLVIFGLVVFNRIAVRELPDIDPSIVTIRTLYKGASAEIVDSQITQKIEDIVGGTPGLATISSKSEDGRSVVTVEFEPGVIVDEAANDIRDRVSRIIDNLPDNATRPEIFKTSEGNQVAIWLRLRSERLSALELSDYASRYLKDYFSSVDGVGNIILSGEKELSLRIWLNPTALSARDVTVGEIENILLKENIEFPSGKLESKKIDLILKLDKSYKNLEDYKNLVIKKGRDGSITKLKDVAKVEFGPLNVNTLFKGNGFPVLGIGLYQQSNANTIAVVDGVKKRLEEVKKNLPEGIQLEVAFDRSSYIRVAVKEVYIALFLSVALVVGIIYLFLGNLTSVIIPTLAIPVSIISTFLLIYAANFSLNLFTLMALVIAIGLVVDDAIVMLENIYRRMETGETALVGSYKGASQVSFAIISTTVVLVAVFVPLIFIKGIVGKLFTELALTLSFSVIISAFVALTLSPMLASKYLKVTHEKPKFLKKFDYYLDKFSNFYFESLLLLLYKKKEVIIFLSAVLISVIILFKITPKELIPPEDRGVFFVIIQAPDGSGFEYTKEQSENIEKIFLSELGKGTYREVLTRIPGFGSGPDQVNNGFIIVLLENWAKRKKFGGQDLGEIFQKLNSFPAVKAFPIMPQSLRGGAADKPVQFVLKGNTYEELIKWKEIIKAEVVNNKNFVNVDDDLDLTKPQLKIKVNTDKAADLGVPIDAIGKSLETLFGSKEVTKYTRDGREYSVILQTDINNRQQPSNLNKVSVRSNTGKLVPLANLVTYIPESTYTGLNRYNRQRAVTISARITAGYSINEALLYLESIVKQKLPSYAGIDYKGESLEFKNTSSDIYFIFFLAIFTAYLSLAAQFESWRHPLTIMLTVPLAILGGIIGLWTIGSSLNIYSQIALIVLIGLAAKNGILIVEFANQLRAEGMKIKEAIITSCKVRLRPILMTSASTVMGVVPLVIATGAGSASRETVGIVIFMGVIFSTFFTLYVIPTMYLIIGQKTERIDAVEIELEKQLKEQSNK